MLEESFKEMVILAKDDSDVMVYLLEILSPLIKSYIKKLFFLEQEDAQQELIVAIIEEVKGISKCESINEIDLSQVAYFEKYADVEMVYDIQIKGKTMTKNQKDILGYLLLGYTDREISDILGISWQYINKIKKKLI